MKAKLQRLIAYVTGALALIVVDYAFLQIDLIPDFIWTILSLFPWGSCSSSG